MSARRTSLILWVIQSLLAALFLFAGGFKLAMSYAALAQAIALPPLFMKFIALCEVTGALGLVLPGALRMKRGLTPLAAACLIPIMIGAVTLTVLKQGVASAVLPAIVGVLLAVVARGRWSWRVGADEPASR